MLAKYSTGVRIKEAFMLLAIGRGYAIGKFSSKPLELAVFQSFEEIGEEYLLTFVVVYYPKKHKHDGRREQKQTEISPHPAMSKE